MNKTTTFFWAWQNGQPRRDDNMSRDRAARILSAWRNSTRLSEMSGFEGAFKRAAPHVYQFTDFKTGQSGTLTICKNK